MKLRELMKPAPSVVQKAASKEEIRGLFRQLIEKNVVNKNLWTAINDAYDAGTITDRTSLIKKIHELTKIR